MPAKKKKKRIACPSCGGNFQRGAHVWRLTPDGPKRQRVCKTCAAYAVPVLASDAPARCEQCKTRLAAVCMGCVKAVFEQATGAKIPAGAIATRRK